MSTEHPTPELPDAEDDQEVVLGHVRHADVVFLAWLDAWIDKSISDGTLTPEKASAYREAIAARCAQLGDVPNIVGAVQRLDIKPGDTLVFVAPVDNVTVVHRMHEQISAFLDGTGVQAIAVPPGTEIKVLHPESQGPDLRIETFSTVKGKVFQVTHIPTGLAASGPTKAEALRNLEELLPAGPRRYDYPIGSFSAVPSPLEWPKPGTPEYDAMKAHWESAIADGAMAKEQFVAELRAEARQRRQI